MRRVNLAIVEHSLFNSITLAIFVYNPLEKMFVEPHLGKFPFDKKHAVGWIEVICGSMFSGKTEELIRRLNRALLAGQEVEIFKPSIDKRYHPNNVVSHNANKIRCTPVDFSEDILLISSNSNVVGIDEGQFFDDRLIEVCNRLAVNGKRVIVAGLDMDFSGKPFGPMPELIATAEFVTKVHAICMVCGAVASYSFRLSSAKEKILVGAKLKYEARCRRCFNKGMEKT